MTEIVKIQLEWTYIPKDYFPYEINRGGLGYKIHFENGKIFVELEYKKINFNEEFMESISKLVNIEFQAVQIQTGLRYDLNGPARSNVLSDGSINQIISLKPVIVKAIVGRPTIYQVDKNGNLINESVNKLQKEQSLISTKIIENKDDVVLLFLLDCLQKSIEEPEKIISHVYNMRDALSKSFSGDEIACDNLNISKNMWKQIGIIANRAPIQESRHRGFFFRKLRFASEREIKKVKEIRTLFLMNYLDYLDKKNSSEKK